MESPDALAMAVFSELKIISKLVLRTKDLLPIVSIGSTEVDKYQHRTGNEPCFPAAKAVLAAMACDMPNCLSSQGSPEPIRGRSRKKDFGSVAAR